MTQADTQRSSTVRMIGTLIVVAVALCAPPAGLAQEPVKSFDQLNTRLKVGDTVWVTDAQGREIQGKIQALAPDALTLKADAPRAFTAADVRMIRERQPDSLKNGALIGLGAGGALGILACAAIAGEGEAGGWCAMAIGVYGGLGTVIGVGIDALIPGGMREVYRAPGAAPGARLSVAPLIGRTSKGVAFSFAF